MKVNAYRVLNHPTTDTVYSKTRAGYYVAAGYAVEHETERIPANQENES